MAGDCFTLPLSTKNQDTAEQLLQTWQKGHMHPSTLLYGLNHGAAVHICQRLIMKALGGAYQTNKPHPDVMWLGLTEDESGKQSLSLSIEQVRGARAFAYKSSVTGGPRFLIIDPAEALTPQAQNALLKTLEAPPKGVYFMLISSHLHALIATIRSRCQKHPIYDHDFDTFQKGLMMLNPDAAYDSLPLKWICALKHGDYTAVQQLEDFDFEGFEEGCDQLITQGNQSALLKMIYKVAGKKDKKMVAAFVHGLLLALVNIKNYHQGAPTVVPENMVKAWAKRTSLAKVAEGYRDLSSTLKQHDQLGLDPRQTMINAVSILGRLNGNHQ
jgi:hypothetical protein